MYQFTNPSDALQLVRWNKELPSASAADPLGLNLRVSARLAKQAVANIGNQPVDAVEEIWHGLTPPYRPLFDWLLHGAPRPSTNAGGAFLPLQAYSNRFSSV